MSPERWRQIEELYHAALERDPERRSEFLAEACPGDEELRRELESLLAQEGASLPDLETLDLPAPGAQQQIILHYRILEKLGEGGMGVVYRADDTKLGRTVALKFLVDPARPGEQLNKRLMREAQAAARLDHPNICPVYGLEEVEGRRFIVMAMLEGETLQQRLRGGPLSLGQAVEIAIQVAQGLQEAHDRGIVHRDIKPPNIFLTEKGIVKITDFGLALLADRSRITKAGDMLGTVHYMAPEQFLAATVDRRSDIWSLGVVLYEMSCGSRPFQGNEIRSAMQAIIEAQPRPLARTLKGCPPELDRIVRKTLSKNREERYQHVDDMIVDLRAVRNLLPAEEWPAAVIRPRPATGPRADPLTDTIGLSSLQMPERRSPAARRTGILVMLLFSVLILAGLLIAWWRFS